MILFWHSPYQASQATQLYPSSSKKQKSFIVKKLTLKKVSANKPCVTGNTIVCGWSYKVSTGYFDLSTIRIV